MANPNDYTSVPQGVRAVPVPVLALQAWQDTIDSQDRVIARLQREIDQERQLGNQLKVYMHASWTREMGLRRQLIRIREETELTEPVPDMQPISEIFSEILGRHGVVASLVCSCADMERPCAKHGKENE